ncbi:hypothetical protein ACFV1W_32950 [Kitasatospora sp. NPDC059648]|uniref:hypothetical protein n=1 Tax=Kitasatospora sp. NPDC059648 TaxID=3346894 RepID=UPI0036BD94BA
MSTPRIPVAAVVVAGAAVVALTGCASNDMDLSGSPSAASASPTAAPVPPTVSGSPVPGSPSATPSGPKPLSGRQLKPLLPTSATLPAGWTMKDSTESDTGDAFEDEPNPTLLNNPCTWLSTASGGTLGLGYQSAHAMEMVSDGDNESRIDLGSYFPGTAVKQLDLIRSYADKCKSYTGQDWDKKPVPHTVTVTPVPNLGDEAIDLVNTPKGPYATQEVLAVRIGDKILFLDGDNVVDRLPHIKDLAAPIAKHIKEVAP